MNQSNWHEALAHELKIVWLEDITRLNYVRMLERVQSRTRRGRPQTLFEFHP